MAHSLSAKKRVRQNLKSRLQNRRRMRITKDAIKEFISTVHDGKVEDAQKQLSGLYKLLDQISAKGTLHKNAVARYKSKLTVRFNTLKGPKTSKAA